MDLADLATLNSQSILEGAIEVSKENDSQQSS